MSATTKISPPMQPVRVLDVPVHPVTLQQLHAYLGGVIDSEGRALVLHVNVHGLNIAVEQPSFRAFFERADLVFCDGAGVMLGARILGNVIPERVTYAAWVPHLATFCEQRGDSFFFLGGKPGVAARAAEALRKKHPALEIVGARDGYFDHAADSAGTEEVIAQINAAAPDILIVGLGMPLQEEWLTSVWPRLNVRIGLTGGAVFDYVSGDLRRGPPILTDHGMEWLARLIIEPRRLARRYLVGNPLFAYRIARSWIGARRGTR
jgi:N-acetylglucosaminyldiphosphoundecaprenol N-acetyl-beta-D-mannosaminyltransferase